MIDYFELYKTCLKVLSEKQPDQISDFLRFMNNEEIIKSELAKGIDNRQLVLATFEVLDNLTDDGLIKSKKIVTKTEDPFYLFSGITTTGYHYLKSLEDPKFKEKLRATLKEEGIPMTPNSITKVIAKLTL